MFSDREEKIIKIIGIKKMSIGEVATKLFEKLPLDSSILVANSITRINRKCKFYNLTWSIKKERKKNTTLVSREKVCL